MSTATLAQQRAFFETFGFLKLPGLLKAEIGTILSEHEAVFPQMGLNHDGTQRTFFVPFIDQRAGLCALLDHPGILEAVGNLIGPDFNYVSSDGNYYSGNTTWHLDGNYLSGGYIKVAFYLDPLTRDTGALRVIPGSHRDGVWQTWDDEALRAAPEVYGCDESELPAVALETQPGDVLIFNHRLRHASFGGGKRRRMFTMNLGARARTPQEIDDFISYISAQWLGWMDEAYGETMLATASPARKVHLTQVFEYIEAGKARRDARRAKESSAV